MKHKLVKNKNTNNHLIKLLMITISLIVLTALPVMAQPKGRFIYSGSYDYNGNQISKQTNYTTLIVTPYQSPNQSWLKVQGITKSGQRYNLPSSSGRYVFTKYRSGYSVYSWDEQCLIVNSRQNVIQFYRDVTSGKYDEFITY
mgnify:CR=1 FL=1